MNFSDVFSFDTREACGLAFGIGRRGWIGLTFSMCPPSHAHSVSVQDWGEGYAKILFSLYSRCLRRIKFGSSNPSHSMLLERIQYEAGKWNFADTAFPHFH